MSNQLDAYFFSLWKTLKTFTDASGVRGTTRLAFTKADQDSRRWLREVWETIGLTTFIDGLGNLVGIHGNPPYVLLSSHTDTVPEGGDYDGILGILAATAVAHDWAYPDRGLMLVNWSSEESSRFGISTLGSRLAVGEDQARYWDTWDRTGTTLKEAVQQSYGYPDVPVIRLLQYAISAALELHIEQGTTLQEQGMELGIVTAIAAPQRWHVSIQGQANHSGGTAMRRRHDALAAASQLTLGIETLSAELESSGLRSTMTTLDVQPGASNVIPGQVDGLIDVRAQSQEILNAYTKALDDLCQQIRRQRSVRITRHVVSGETPSNLNRNLMDRMKEVLDQRKISWTYLPSWPSHDSLPLSRHLPTAMLFVRNPSGISHNADEDIAASDIHVALRAFNEIVTIIHEKETGD